MIGRSQMKVEDINGVCEAATFQELETRLMRRHGDGFNSFWLSHGGEDYPTLSLLVKGELATLAYITAKSDAGFRSVGNMLELTPGEMTTFSISMNRADDICVLNDAVLPFSAALRAAKEFFVSKDLPASVKWLDLGSDDCRLYYLGTDAIINGQWEAACDYLSKSLAVRPHAKTCERLAFVWDKLGQAQASEKMLEKAYELNPKVDLIANRYAGMLYLRGELDKARSVLTGILARNPTYGPAKRLMEEMKG